MAFQRTSTAAFSSVAALAMAWVSIACLLAVATADVGTATSYSPPYLPTRCPGYNRDRLPDGGLFAAASPGVWDNGAACGRKYRLRCLSGLGRPCKAGTIVVEIVDVCRTSPCPATIVLSGPAFETVSSVPRSKINIEFTEI